MDKHCKGCVYHNIAGHPKDSNLYKSAYNDWCTKYSGRASDKVGHCKLNKGKKDGSSN